MGDRLNGWRLLNGMERGQLLLIALGLQVVHGGVRVFGYQRTQAWLGRHSFRVATHAASATEWRAATRLAELGAIAGRHTPIHATCLRQSLLLYWLLRRRGLQPELRLGVRKQGEALDAHAWVELEGRALSPAPVQHQPFNLPDR